ncbi:PREDICTED: 7-deoxyloganetic acid glucosyltransferase-like [Ipomoea nil]|uniref:7-deoxyloganetic acid glucosyltransferase-like n=1 Tax=Ipomoea nil TaxID=35883 RepID=UPI00090198AA|nr:PREDICTED: 7-deoxyloganetic acid glucosyltransferase-like [Ipomoea nil]
MEFIGHILIFPLPAQSHLNSMLKLAHLLDLANFHITFFVPSNIHARLLALTDVDSGRFTTRFRLQSFPPGIYDGALNSKEVFVELCDSLRRIGKPFLKQYIAQNRDSGLPFTCFISDLLVSIALDVSEECFNLPVYYFRPISACAFWTYFSLPDLFEAGELPIKGNGIDSSPITKVKGMEDFLRVRDLSPFCRDEDLAVLYYTEARLAVQARGLILNTFEDLEGPILSQIRTKYPNVYTIGPLHAHLKATLASKSTHSNSLLQEDETCMAWLDSQEPKSVIYVSFGSISVITRQQLMEFWYGLVNSGKKFLWVMRSDLVAGKDDEESPIPSELEEGTKANGYIVGWAPQEAVLDHPAVGGFLTHSGWNSTLESIVAGVPMICWPLFADQQTNSRFVGEVWKLGLDMKDVCDRSSVEKLIRELMEKRKGEFLERAENMAKLGKQAISEGGSSYCNFDCLIQDIIKVNEATRKPQ